MGGKNNINKIRGPTNEKTKRIARGIAKSKSKFAPAITCVNVRSKKKQRQFEKAVSNEKKLLAKMGLIEYVPEEEMSDVVKVSPEMQRISVEVAPELLAAAAAGQGTTLGGPQ
ncbi:hypothetical protein CLU79DRAFT_727655 [Phycomyces nitens]|nr:hypothetical protein CLU79DRAFT_727655 [Phycomyces nitens]